MDHKPLVKLFSTTGAQHATPRIAKWQYRLQMYDYHVEYVLRARNLLADCLSHLPSGNVYDGEGMDEDDVLGGRCVEVCSYVRFLSVESRAYLRTLGTRLNRMRGPRGDGWRQLGEKEAEMYCPVNIE
ncbi:hypothetical protein NDU88_004839 [Pleurodeles waltl]|uniref:Reverse transcriptase RNase H-like domain-containing protein n=1 Tax=Pleurodeles waltl TaxID=8319 RepID=A0AAV7RGS0_PLEWA|nr:hypothetical protein NDU88_004839 [Pleurodeles waltl]